MGNTAFSASSNHITTFTFRTHQATLKADQIEGSEMSRSQTSEMLLGALVSDAACLGLHWIYDAERIAEITARHDGKCAFAPVDAANFEGVLGYFAHGGRHSGMLTQYGEVLRLAIQSMNANNGAFDVDAYQAAFVAHFGPGGTYQGYIDRPTRAALDNIAAEKFPSGIDDDQNPAVSRLPAILAKYHTAENLPEMIKQSMQITNVNDAAAAYSAAFSDVLSRVMHNEPLGDALDAAAHSADQSIKTELLDALSTRDSNSTDYAGLVGRACHLPTAGPVMFHILKHSDSYREAVERNILAGGDSAGRAILIGAIMGRVHGVATPKGIPLSWTLQLDDARQIWQDCEQLAAS
ncbi:MAG: ADP-ribosylglycohydrolase [Ascidiaceihabitans sp.]